MARVQKFESFPLLNRVGGANTFGNGSLVIQAFNLEGSLSFNKVILLGSASGTTARTLSLSFGLYSMSGATLSLANSASGSFNNTGISFLTLITSATQDLTPGTWFWAYIRSSSGSTHGLYRAQFGAANAGSTNYAGPFWVGQYSVTTNALPASIATSDMLKYFSTSSQQDTYAPYIVISA